MKSNKTAQAKLTSEIKNMTLVHGVTGQEIEDGVTLAAGTIVRNVTERHDVDGGVRTDFEWLATDGWWAGRAWQRLSLELYAPRGKRTTRRGNYSVVTAK